VEVAKEASLLLAASLDHLIQVVVVEGVVLVAQHMALSVAAE
jgi:hypothetical protein